MADLKTETTKSDPPPPPSKDDEKTASAGVESNGKAHAAKATIDGAAAPKDDATADAKASANADADTDADANADAHADAKDEADADADLKASEAAGEEDHLLPRGNPLRWTSLILAGGSAVFAFLLMAKQGQLRIGVPLGAIFAALATYGTLDFLGTFDDKGAATSKRTVSELTVPVALSAGAFVAFLTCVGLAGWGFLSGIGGGLVVTASFILLVMALFKLGVAFGPLAKDEDGNERGLLSRHGFWVVVVGACLYFPTLGLFSLWDPWETHYGEVAREILARDDWVSLWWAQDGWFWSKPILNFWIQSLSMATLGTHYHSDQMLMGYGDVASAHPEWVVRMPNVLFTLAAMYVLYKGVAKVFGRRAGMLGTIVLATTPHWFFLAHQTMTDMPFVASMTAAMGFLMLGLYTNEHDVAKIYELDLGGRKLKISAFHLVFGAIIICALPQALYLLSRNIELVLSGPGPRGFRPHWDEFRSGSAVNCGLPGNENCNTVSPAQLPKGLAAMSSFTGGLVHFFGGIEPTLQAIVWLVMLGVLLYVNWGERRTRRLLYIAAWFCTAIATMGKGPAGFILPMVCAFAYLATKRKFSELLQMEFLSGLLVLACVAAPWFVAMYVRHGSPFVDRLFFHDMFNRAFGHVHDTNEGDDTSFRFYIWQLGYSLFPWTGLAPLGLTYWLRRSDSADRGKGDVSVFLVMWAVFAFALFTFMGTKFHHYIFPAAPPISMLVGIALDDMLGKRTFAQTGKSALYFVGALGSAFVFVYGLSRIFPGSVMGTIAGHDLVPFSWPMRAVGIGLALVGVGGFVVTFLMFGTPPAPVHEDDELEDQTLEADPAASPYRGGAKATVPEVSRFGHERLMVGGAVVAGAVALILVARDLALDAKATGDQPGAIRLVQLFTYNYRRPWPDSLDFTGVLTAFGIAAAVLMLFLAVRRMRVHAVAAFSAFALVWAVWGVDVYMMKTAPHWGQHEIMEAYYRDRKDPKEMLIAYQMNWKGENFYTSNHIPAFVSTGSTFTNWLKDQKAKGVHTMYFVTEHGRVGGLKSEVSPKQYTELTDKNLNNKFVLIRAEL
jgi:4-amino-4-deoxy-L-arabinose transferase-like glycosyltransferase